MGLHYLGGRENNAEEMVWASIIWAITITTSTITTITITITITVSITITRLVLAGVKIMETKWFGPPLFGRGGKIMERKWFGPPLFGRGGK